MSGASAARAPAHHPSRHSAATMSGAERLPPWVLVLMRLRCTRPALDVVTHFRARRGHPDLRGLRHSPLTGSAPASAVTDSSATSIEPVASEIRIPKSLGILPDP